MTQFQLPVSCCFWFQKSYTGNILGIGRNKNPTSYFSRKYTEFEGESKKANREATPPLGVGPPLAMPRHGVGPLASTDVALSPI